MVLGRVLALVVLSALVGSNAGASEAPDVVGVQAGMTVEEVEASLSGRGLTAQDPWKRPHATILKLQSSEETITAIFVESLGGPSQLVSVTRNRRYPEDGPLIAATEAALQQKYGEPIVYGQGLVKTFYWIPSGTDLEPRRARRCSSMLQGAINLDARQGLRTLRPECRLLIIEARIHPRSDNAEVVGSLFVGLHDGDGAAERFQVLVDQEERAEQEERERQLRDAPPPPDL